MERHEGSFKRNFQVCVQSDGVSDKLENYETSLKRIRKDSQAQTSE